MLTIDSPKETVDAEVVEKKDRLYVPPTNFYANSSPKIKGQRSSVSDSLLVTFTALKLCCSHDPTTPEALVLKAPTKEHIKKYNKR